jgi:drug/metabolite transporter (DMT)-like permease
VSDGRAPRPAEPTTTRATLLALLAAASFALLGPLTVLITRDGTPLVVAMTWRFGLGGALLLALAWHEGGRRIVWPDTRALWRLVTLGGLGQLVVTWLSLKSLDYIPAPTQVFLFYSYPAWVTVVQAVRGAERLDGRRVGALVLAVVGILLVLDPRTLVAGVGAGAGAGVGVALALVAAFCYAIYVPLLGWLQRDTSPTLASATITLSGSVLFAVTALAMHGQLLPRASAVSMGGLLALGVVSTGVAFWAFMRALAGLGSVRLAILSTAEPFIASCYAAVLLGQRPGPLAAVGGLCIVTAVVWLVRPATARVGVPAASS